MPGAVRPTGGRRSWWLREALAGEPAEPLRHVGARLVRGAIVRAELAEERGVRGSRLLREVSRLPRRLGCHLGPE